MKNKFGFAVPTLLAGFALVTAAAVAGYNGSTTPPQNLVSDLSGNGSDSSGGADLTSPYDGVAWFLGKDKTIQVCFEVGADFEGPREGLQNQIEKAFKTWGDYYEYKTFVPSIPENVTVVNKPEGPDFPGLTFRAHIVQAQPGGCASRQPDLTIYFGGQTDSIGAINRYKSAAFAKITDKNFGYPTGWYKGFIWMQGGRYYVRDEAAVFGLLLHELGHVFGCSHTPGTIMDAKIADALSSIAADDSPEYFKQRIQAERLVRLTKIDQSRELVIGSQTDYTLAGFAGRIDNHPTKYIAPLYQQLMGREIQGKLIIQLKKGSGWTFPTTLILGDDSGTTEFQIDPSDFDSFATQSKAFAAVLEGQRDADGRTRLYEYGWSAGQGEMTTGTITGASGSKYTIQLIWNIGAGYALSEDSIGIYTLSVRVSAGGIGDFRHNYTIYLRPANWL